MWRSQNGFHYSTGWGFGPAGKPTMPPDARRRECVFSRRLRIRVNGAVTVPVTRRPQCHELDRRLRHDRRDRNGDNSIISSAVLVVGARAEATACRNGRLHRRAATAAVPNFA